MGLGGRREKQRIPDDPRNMKWATDTTTPGFKMLSKMGWNPESKTLKPDQVVAGKQKPVVPIAKDDTMGIGASRAFTSTSIITKASFGGSMNFVSEQEAIELEKDETEAASKTKSIAADATGFAGLLAKLNQNSAATVTPSSSSASALNSDNEEPKDQDSADVKESKKSKKDKDRKKKDKKKRKDKAESEEEEEDDQSSSDKKSKKRKRSKQQDQEDTESEEKKKKEKKSKKKDRSKSPKEEDNDKEQESPSKESSKESTPTFSRRNVSRSKHIRSKRMLLADQAAMAEVLGIAAKAS